MKRFFFLLIVFTLFGASAFSQKSTITGYVADKTSGEKLIGVSIMYAQGKGVITDLDGNFKLNLDYGTYSFKVSYVGYNLIEKKVIIDKPKISLNFKLENTTLKEVEIVSDVARTRETPVAFSNIKPAKLEEELASQDLPMILNLFIANRR